MLAPCFIQRYLKNFGAKLCCFHKNGSHNTAYDPDAHTGSILPCLQIEILSIISPQAPAALWRLYGVVSVVTGTAAVAISPDWLRAPEVEGEKKNR